jgi:hypothetical protein
MTIQKVEGYLARPDIPECIGLDRAAHDFVLGNGSENHQCQHIGSNKTKRGEHEKEQRWKCHECGGKVSEARRLKTRRGYLFARIALTLIPLVPYVTLTPFGTREKLAALFSCLTTTQVFPQGATK